MRVCISVCSHACVILLTFLANKENIQVKPAKSTRRILFHCQDTTLQLSTREVLVIYKIVKLSNPTFCKDEFSYGLVTFTAIMRLCAYGEYPFIV